ELKNKIKEKYSVEYVSSRACNHNYLLFKQDELIYNAKFSKGNLLLLPFWCLDNVSCNDEGVVDFKYDTEGLRYPLKKCIEKAKKSYEDIYSKIKDNIDIFEFISIAYLNNKTKCTIKRIGKFESDIANEIYKEFINNQTRIPKKNVIKL
ncbi:MAG: hypothetical protein K2K50_07035, partial [Anaeroplasmataceae bacterium]|nr:hypothetical protein [Anaeroplasmataceae bacterium]